MIDTARSVAPLSRFRESVPVLQRLAWLDTPAAAPPTQPVVEALRAALDEWESGLFSWQGWEAVAFSTRALFARLIGASPENVSLMSSFAEAAATIAQALPKGRIVVGANEFRSNLFPWLSLESRGFEVTLVPARDGFLRTEDLVAHTAAGTVLVAVSEVLSCDGNRADLRSLAARCTEVDARLFVDVTQSLGALRLDVNDVKADFVAGHGYKWLLAPRGCAWLYARPDRLPELSPLAPSWKSAPDPYRAYFGGPLELAADARRLDASLSWLPWIGARAALELLLSFDAREIEARAVSLAARLREEVRGIGVAPLEVDTASQIVVIPIDDGATIGRRLNASNVRAAIVGGNLRFGFHGFNDDSDVDAALRVLAG